MKSTNITRKLLPIVKWVARIWGGLAAAFLIFMVIAHLVEAGGWSWPSGADGIAFVFFPVGVAAGLLMAMKWNGLGGSTTIVSTIAWHIIMYMTHGEPEFEPMIDGLAVPGLLFLVTWLISRRLSRDNRR